MRSCLDGTLLLVLGTALAASGWRAAYALGALAAALIVSGRRTRSSDVAGSAQEIDAPHDCHTAKSAA